MWCHLLLAAPLVGLLLFTVLPLPLAFPLYSLIALGSLALYKQVWQSLKMRPVTGRQAMLQSEAWAVTEIDARGHGLVRWRGELWSARAATPMAAGTEVRIVGFEGLKVIVQRPEARPVDAADQPERACHGGRARAGDGT